VAEREHAETFAVGTELSSLEGAARWKSVVSAARRVFSGEIVYDANWVDYLAKPVNVPVDRLGVDAYFPLQLPDTASVSEVVAGWNSWLDRKNWGSASRIMFSEAGIVAQNGAYRAPGDFHNRRTFNPHVQPTWYAAVCRVAQRRRAAGVYFWEVNFDTDPSQPAPASGARLEFAGHPLSEQAIRGCFATTYTVR
jgi:hypothetical protein